MRPPLGCWSPCRRRSWRQLGRTRGRTGGAATQGVAARRVAVGRGTRRRAGRAARGRGAAAVAGWRSRGHRRSMRRGGAFVGKTGGPSETGAVLVAARLVLLPPLHAPRAKMMTAGRRSTAILLTLCAFPPALPQVECAFYLAMREELAGGHQQAHHVPALPAGPRCWPPASATRPSTAATSHASTPRRTPPSRRCTRSC